MLRNPARLSQKMLLKSKGSLHTGDPAGRVACKRALFREEERPAGAAEPSEVIAVAVVTFFMIVLLNTRTRGASFIEMPPPSWVETFPMIMLL